MFQTRESYHNTTPLFAETGDVLLDDPITTLKTFAEIDFTGEGASKLLESLPPLDTLGLVFAEAIRLRQPYGKLHTSPQPDSGEKVTMEVQEKLVVCQTTTSWDNETIITFPTHPPIASRTNSFPETAASTTTNPDTDHSLPYQRLQEESQEILDVFATTPGECRLAQYFPLSDPSDVTLLNYLRVAQQFATYVIS